MDEKIDFAWPVTSENAVVYQFFVAEIERLKEEIATKRIIIFGAGIRGCCLLHVLEQHGFENIVFCDNNPEKQENRIHSYDILSLKDTLRLDGPQVFLVSPENSDTMQGQLLEVGLQKGRDWFSFSISIYDAYIAEYLRPAQNHLLVMGDCAFSHIALTDTVTDSLGDMMKKRMGDAQCKVLAMHGLGQQAYYHILCSLLDKQERPSMVLLLLVLECLTPKAHLMPRTQHPQLMDGLLKTLPTPREEFSAYATLAQERFDRFQVESFASSPHSKDTASEKLFMKMNYLFKIREDAEGMTYLKKIIQLLNNEAIPITLYIPPVNYMQGEKFFGSTFKERYWGNFEKLFSFLNMEGLTYEVVDASYLLTVDEFAAANTIDETANYKGRSKVINFLCRAEQVDLLSAEE